MKDDPERYAFTYLSRVDVIQVVLNELDGGAEITLIELVRDVPADRAELSPFLNRGMQERYAVQHRLPLHHVCDVEQFLIHEPVRTLETGLHALRRFGREFYRGL